MPTPRPSTSLRTALALATLGLGCNKLPTSLSGGGEEAAADAKAQEVKAEVPVAPPIAPSGPATVDQLLALVHEGAPGYALFKDPAVLLGFAEAAVQAYEGPMQAFGSVARADSGAGELGKSFAEFKEGVGAVKAALAKSGVDLTRGVVASDTGLGSDDLLLVFAAPSADAAKEALTTLMRSDAGSLTCQAIAAHPGYVGCAKEVGVLAAYKPGDAKARRQAAEAALPGIALDDVAMLGLDADSRSHFAASTPAGTGVVHFSMPPDSAEARAMLQPGSAELLRFAPAGTGFLWLRTDLEALKRQTPSLGVGVPGLDAIVGSLNGEVLLGATTDPTALQARVGLTDTKAVAGLPDLAVMFVGKSVPKSLPGLPGSKLVFEAKELTIGTEVVRALHLGVSGVPTAKTLADKLGLGLDAWIFAADKTLAVAVGVDAAGAARLVAPPAADATLATLPPPLAQSIRANEVDFILHVPLDGLQSPTLRQALAEGFKSVPDYNPSLVQAGLGLLSPLSTTTIWLTEHADRGVLHFSVQAIGHGGDEEGKAALVAAAAADPVAAFAALAGRYTGSPRLAAYQARAGLGGPGTLIGSSAPALMAGAAAAYLFIPSGPPMPPPDVQRQLPEEAPTGAKSDAEKSDASKTDTTKTDTTKSDASKTDAEKSDASKTDAEKSDASKGDAGKSGTLEIDTSKLGGTGTAPKRIGRGATTPKPKE